MKIVWDEVKRQANLRKHGFDFAALDVGFFLTAVIRPAKHGRHRAIGRLEDGSVAVIFAYLGREGISVISMRPASLRERRLLDE